MSQIAVRTLPDCTRAKAGPTVAELKADALEQIDAAISALQDMRGHVVDVDPEAPGVAWQAHRCGRIAVACAGQAVADARNLAYLTRPLDE